MQTNELTGRIVSIQRCSIHDGPGLRTTVFMKGCQLSCPWCHNPEAISFDIQEMRYPEKCIGCGQCEYGCFSGARTSAGKDMTIEEVMLEVTQDDPFYGSEGGVTLSGGEPLCQLPFLLTLLDICKARDLHTAVESNLCFPAETVIPVFERINLLLADLKFDSSEKHKQWTGKGNETVRSNLLIAAQMGIPVVVRTPVIPGVNSDIEEIRKIARFASSIPTLLFYELLTYHPLGTGKAKALGREQTEFQRPSREDMRSIAQTAAAEGVPVLIDSKPFSL